MIAALLGSFAGTLFGFAADAPVPARRYEGDWYIADTTDNVTGERDVYASNLYVKPDNFVTLTMRCSNGRPTFFVDWDDVTFPDQAVLTIGPRATLAQKPASRSYVFAKSNDAIEHGLKAAPETSQQIVAAMVGAQSAVITAHLSSGSRAIEIDVKGAAGAWARVVRHCPVKTMALPPI
ncbi:hypothetical protein [Sphingomonas aquatilis]|uniref:hypothetical protein n=1 Tax=Sphingomonas aquatilis TaxID=93063 RepID=UPI0023F94862|nr:hypothetical protein [Sphingomonas aquatilis]MCI4653106.1 hypothetical protein [Sphingomonas aquatilis]